MTTLPSRERRAPICCSAAMSPVCPAFARQGARRTACPAVAASMIFEAEELGVHSLWIRGFDSQDVIEAFALPPNHVPVMMLALGYPSDKSHPAHLHGKRKAIEETVTYL